MSYNNTCCRMKQEETDEALKHLGNVLYILSDLHPDDQSRAYVEALEFYNAAFPDCRIEPTPGFSTRLLNTSPLG